MSLYEQQTNITTFKQFKPTDITVTPFNAYKPWTLYHSSKLPTGYYNYTTYYQSNLTSTFNTYIKNIQFSGFSGIQANARSVNIITPNIRYNELNHLFYQKNDSYHVYGTRDINNTNKNLYLTASVLSFPQDNIGDGIKPKSFSLVSASVSLADDRFGNIYDTELDTTRFIPNTMFYEGFNEYFDIKRRSSNPNDNRYYTGSVLVDNGVLTTSPIVTPIGYSARFNGTGSLIVKNSEIDGTYNKNTNYAISLFVSASNVAGTSPRTLICKNGIHVPYHITIQPNYKIGFYIHTANRNSNDSIINIDKTTNIFVTSSTAVTSSWNHVVCQKSGSYLQIYVNNVLEANKQFTELIESNSPLNYGYELSNTSNDLFIGGWPYRRSTSFNYVGKLDEIRIYDKALTETQCSYLSDLHVTGSMLQTNIVGNIFYKHGLAVISSPNNRYNDITKTAYTASFKSTITKYELSACVKVRSSEFNNSINSTLTDISGYRYNSDLLNSTNFTPYITSIGFYNEFGELLMVGKLSQPIKKRNDVDLNFIVRVDLDNYVITK